MSVRDLIDAIASGDSIATQQAFEQEMMSRVAARIDDKRVEVAQNMFSSEEAIAEDAEQLDELSKSTLASYAKKAAKDAKGTGFNAGKQLGQAVTGPEVGSALNVDAKAHKRLGNVNKAIDRLAKEDVSLDEQTDKIHPNHVHVERVPGNKYKVHNVGDNWSSGIKQGEHLNDTELDDLAEMGAKIKHVKPAK